MNKHLGIKYDEMGKVFEKWSAGGELVSLSIFFLISSLLTINSTGKHLSGQNWRRHLRTERQVGASCPWRYSRQSRPRHRWIRRNWHLVKYSSNISPHPCTHPFNCPLLTNRFRIQRRPRTRQRNLPWLIPPFKNHLQRHTRERILYRRSTLGSLYSLSIILRLRN